MRLVSATELKAGWIVGRAVLDATGRVLLQEGVVLSDPYIEALRAKGYTQLYIRDPEDLVEVDIEENVSPAVRIMAFQTLRDTYVAIEKEVTTLRVQSQKQIVEAFSSENVKVLLSEKGFLTSIISIASSILEEVLSRGILAGLTSIKSADTLAYDHGIDTCAVAIMIGSVAGLDNVRLRQLAVGALLHDIGKIFIEPTVQGKARIMQHTKLGYELLKNTENPDLMSPFVAYEHHEHQDGSGLPRGLRGSNTLKRDRRLPPPVPTIVGEIAAVANMYDNLLSGSDRHEPMTPDKTIKVIRDAAGKIFNKEVVAAFVRVVPVYPQGTEVIICDGKYRNFVALVSRVNRSALDRPVITLTRDNHGQRIAPEEIDLNRVRDIEIRSKGI